MNSKQLMNVVRPVIVVLTLLSSGCGLTVQQKAAVAKFSASTQDFGTVTADAIRSTRVEYLEMNVFRKQFRDAALKPQDMDRFFTLERVQIRVAAADALKEYGALLGTLATSSQTAEMKAAADSFVASVKAVPGVSLSPEKAGAIGAAIEAVGGLFIEKMRADAMRATVNNAHPAVLQVVELIEDDFDPEGEQWTLGYHTTSEALRGAAALAEKKLGANDVQGAALIEQARAKADANDAKLQVLGAQIQGSAKALRDAAKNLNHAVQSNNVSVEDIDAYLVQMQKFVSIYDTLKSK